jgi:hypothetical protein
MDLGFSDGKGPSSNIREVTVDPVNESIELVKETHAQELLRPKHCPPPVSRGGRSLGVPRAGVGLSRIRR